MRVTGVPENMQKILLYDGRTDGRTDGRGHGGGECLGARNGLEDGCAKSHTEADGLKRDRHQSGALGLALL